MHFMCGITGLIDFTCSTNADRLNELVTTMSNEIIHRGPDDFGAWVDPENGLALGFRRLAILDLSPTGHQPMHSSNGQYVIVFNGEIYNFSLLRDELIALGYSFKGTSDTEIMLASISQWGLLKAVQKFNGMFAFALWDRENRSLFLVRDRLGIKPLYYGFLGNSFLFGSELKAMRAHPNFDAKIDPQALTLYLRYSNIPGPFTIYKGIYKLPPASILTIKNPLAVDSSSIENIKHYWSAAQTVEDGLTQPFHGSDTEAVDLLEMMLKQSIQQRMIADVPLGAFLSGGIDSSTIVSLMQTQSTQPIRTFTIGFSESGFDESKYASEVARHLHTNHTELYISSEVARDIVPKLPQIYDEPFADPSQIPTFLVSQLAKKSVTVSLSGDGGDELFGGYNRYIWPKKIWDTFGWLPTHTRNKIASTMKTLALQPIGLILKNIGLPNPLDKVNKIANILAAPTIEVVYSELISQWKNPGEIVRGGSEPELNISKSYGSKVTNSLSEKMMAMDLVSYLPDNILVKVDRATMHTSLESRAPFLDDHEIVEFAWTLPLHMKIRNGQGKWILREVLSRHIPKKMIDRPKMGFGVPIDSWLRGPLRPWAENYLNENRLRQEGFFNSQLICKKWNEHKTGKQNWQYDLWNILMFEAWLDETHA